MLIEVRIVGEMWAATEVKKFKKALLASVAVATFSALLGLFKLVESGLTLAALFA